jgi:hypothetical protein
MRVAIVSVTTRHRINIPGASGAVRDRSHGSLSSTERLAVVQRPMIARQEAVARPVRAACELAQRERLPTGATEREQLAGKPGVSSADHRAVCHVKTIQIRVECSSRINRAASCLPDVDLMHIQILPSEPPAAANITWLALSRPQWSNVRSTRNDETGGKSVIGNPDLRTLR